jgi:hypothetical protein
MRQFAAERLGVAAGRNLGGDEQRHDATRSRKLDCSLDECHGKIRQVRESARGGRTPTRISRGERLANPRREPLGAHPRRIAGYYIEAALP